MFSRIDELSHELQSGEVGNTGWVLPQIDHLLATIGDGRFNDRMLDKLDKLLSRECLPGTGGLERRHDMPDHGFAPEPVFLINALAWTKDPRLVERLDRVSSLLHIDPTVSDFRFSYIHSVSYASEILGLPEAGNIAVDLMNRPEIENRLLTRDRADLRETRDYIGERFAYLGMCLARAAARCGNAQGYRRLADYTQEVRLYLARSARTELFELLAVDCGFSRSAWLAEIDGRWELNEIHPVPYSKVLV